MAGLSELTIDEIKLYGGVDDGGGGGKHDVATVSKRTQKAYRFSTLIFD